MEPRRKTGRTPSGKAYSAFRNGDVKITSIRLQGAAEATKFTSPRSKTKGSLKSVDKRGRTPTGKHYETSKHQDGSRHTVISDGPTTYYKDTSPGKKAKKATWTAGDKRVKAIKKMP